MSEYKNLDKLKAARKRAYNKIKNNGESWIHYLELAKHRSKKWKDKHPFAKLAGYLNRRAKKRGESVNLTALSIYQIAKRQKCFCALSGRKLTTENISIDHIIPQSNGGKSEISNLRLVTKATNLAKHCMSDEEFISLCKDIVDNSMISDRISVLGGRHEQAEPLKSVGRGPRGALKY